MTALSLVASNGARVERSTLEAMRVARRWLIHCAKVPFYASGSPRKGTLDTPDDLEQLVGFEHAHAAAEARGEGWGLGFALGPDGVDGCWQGFDFDYVDANGLADLVNGAPGYVELSPSGKGAHAIGYGPRFDALASDGSGIEAYSKGRYFTVTLNQIRDGELCDLSSYVDSHLLPRRKPRTSPNLSIEPVEANTNHALLSELRSALEYIDPNLEPEWFVTLLPLKAFGEAGRKIAREWSARSSKHTDAEFARKWNGLPPAQIDHRAIFAKADRNGWPNPRILPQYEAHEMPFNPATLTANGKRYVEGLGVVSVTPQIVGRKYELLGGADLKARPPLQWLIKGVLPARGLGVLYGPSGSGKSFLAIDLGCSIAEGVSWFDYRTKAADVVYLGLEGEAGFRQRVLAWEAKRGRELPGRFFVIIDKFMLTNPDDIRALAAVCPKGGVVIVDTFARAGDDDPNDPKLRAANIDGAVSLQAEIDGLVLLVAHTGKDEARGMSGQKTPFNAADAAISVTRKDAVRSWKTDKVKDGSDEKEHAFGLTTVFLGVDDDGDPITSCTVERISAAYGEAYTGIAENAADKLFLQLLADFTAQGRTVSAQRSSRTHAALQFAQTPAGKRFKRQGFEAAMERLFAAKRIRVEQVGPASKRKEVIVAVVPDMPSEPFRPSSELLPSGSDPHADPLLAPLPAPSDPLPSDPPYPP